MLYALKAALPLGAEGGDYAMLPKIKICENMRKICEKYATKYGIIFCCHKLNEATPWGFQAFFENL